MTVEVLALVLPQRRLWRAGIDCKRDSQTEVSRYRFSEVERRIMRLRDAEAFELDSVHE